jgi:hypothetical protein
MDTHIPDPGAAVDHGSLSFETDTNQYNQASLARQVHFEGSSDISKEVALIRKLTRMTSSSLGHMPEPAASDANSEPDLDRAGIVCRVNDSYRHARNQAFRAVASKCSV